MAGNARRGAAWAARRWGPARSANSPARAAKADRCSVLAPARKGLRKTNGVGLERGHSNPRGTVRARGQAKPRRQGRSITREAGRCERGSGVEKLQDVVLLEASDEAKRPRCMAVSTARAEDVG